MGTLSDLLALAQQRALKLGLPYQGALTPRESWEVWQLAPGAQLVDIRTRAERDWVGRVPAAVELEWSSWPGMQRNPDFLTQLRQQVDPEALVMFREGDPATHLSIILKGEVNIQYTLGDGELRTVDTLVEGDLLMWSALVEPYHATAMGTTTKETHLLRIDAARLRDLCDRDPLLGYRLMTQVARLLAHRLESARVQLAVV